MRQISPHRLPREWVGQSVSIYFLLKFNEHELYIYCRFKKNKHNHNKKCHSIQSEWSWSHDHQHSTASSGGLEGVVQVVGSMPPLCHHRMPIFHIGKESDTRSRLKQRFFIQWIENLLLASLINLELSALLHRNSRLRFSYWQISIKTYKNYATNQPLQKNRNVSAGWLDVIPNWRHQSFCTGESGCETKTSPHARSAWKVRPVFSGDGNWLISWIVAFALNAWDMIRYDEICWNMMRHERIWWGMNFYEWGCDSPVNERNTS